MLKLAVVRQVLRKELGLKVVEVESEKALVEGGDVLWTGERLSTSAPLHFEEQVFKQFQWDAT